jgi:hypothetical protein
MYYLFLIHFELLKKQASLADELTKWKFLIFLGRNLELASF